LGKNIKSYDFNKKNDDSKKVEALIIEFLESRGNRVEDVSDIEYYRKIDVDLLVHNEKNKIIKLEVKADSTKTKNYFAETISNDKKNTLGCWLLTESDYIAYYFELDKELHIIPTKPAQEYVIKNKNNLTHISLNRFHN